LDALDEEFDLAQILGATCLLEKIHQWRTSMGISGVPVRESYPNLVLETWLLRCIHHCRVLRTMHLSAHLKELDFSQARFSNPNVQPGNHLDFCKKMK